MIECSTKELFSFAVDILLVAPRSPPSGTCQSSQQQLQIIALSGFQRGVPCGVYKATLWLQSRREIISGGPRRKQAEYRWSKVS